MMQGLYTGALGMKTHGEGLQVVSNNLANVSTVGYKQQSALFQDMISRSLSLGTSQEVVTSQVGLGVRVGEIRTLFTDGAYENGSAFSDIALNGKGFFQVVDGDTTHYTRAGNFRFDNKGILTDPTGFALSGIPIVNGKETGQLGPITVDIKDPKLSQNPPLQSSLISTALNISLKSDNASDPENPFFSLLKSYDAKAANPLAQAGYKQDLPYFDAAGQEHSLTISFDNVTSSNGQSIVEFVVSMPASEDTRANAQDSSGAGLLMSGTLTFSAGGELTQMSAFTPGGGDLTDLANWTPASLKDGYPEIIVPGAAGEQRIALNLGVAASGGWAKAPASAADVGTDGFALPSMNSPTYASTPTTNWKTTSSQKTYSQNGYGVGQLADITIGDDGVISVRYTNGEHLDLYRIPVFRFTSEDGLRREGNNHFSATDAAGNMEFGTAGTSNYGSIVSERLELSNVDMSTEMVNLIIYQRGFQSNSKSVTTADAMLQRALELKRN